VGSRQFKGEISKKGARDPAWGGSLLHKSQSQKRVRVREGLQGGKKGQGFGEKKVTGCRRVAEGKNRKKDTRKIVVVLNKESL